LDKLARFIRETVASPNRDQWEEPLRLAVGFLAIDANEQVKVFLEMLHTLSHSLANPEQADWLRAVTVLALFDLPEERLKTRTPLHTRIIEGGLETIARPDLPLRDSLVAALGLALARTNDARLAQPLCDKLTANPPVIKRPAQRRAIGLALAALGDPRFTPTLISGVNVILPKLITIPASNFLMGTSEAEAEQLKAQEAEAWDDEKPQHPVFVSEFQIGQYPLTNAEFRCFIDAKGYETQAYWSDEGWRWRHGQLEADLSVYSGETRKQVEDWLKNRPVDKRHQPFFWEAPQWNADNQPVVGVTWYEAEAYCNWLRALTGHNYGLPTEAQWEKAARTPPPTPPLAKSTPGEGSDSPSSDRAFPVGGGGRGVGVLWPWGNTWDKDKCNSEESGFNATTPVGMYPDGASPSGALDMVGNVWEWCVDWFDSDTYQKRAGQETRDPTGPATGKVRVLRGGSCFSHRGACRAACRDWLVPLYFLDYLGCRVARSSHWSS
jgi:formylglycine-generating enzyme required for sulfatase activity